MSTQTREPAGVPTGGRFATAVRYEGGIFLQTNPPGAVTRAKEAVTEAVLEAHPDATSWKVATTEWDDGHFYDDSNVEVTYPGPEGRPTVVTMDLSRTGAADALREVADEEYLSHWDVMDVTVPREAAA